jgi:hypothetical protein
MIGYQHTEPKQCPVLISFQGELRSHAGNVIQSQEYWKISNLRIYNAINLMLVDQDLRFTQYQDGSWSAYHNVGYGAGQHYGDDRAFHILLEGVYAANPNAEVYLPWTFGQCPGCW